MKTAHTPTPWRKGSKLPDDHAIRINGVNGFLAATARGAGGPWSVVNANADLIIRAVNAHHELVMAAKLVAPAIQSLMNEAAGKKATDWGLVNNCLVDIQRALAKAEARP